ncbi:MAG TPA: adenylate kinase [Candidatus Dormibacteraeota bacterium]
MVVVLFGPPGSGKGTQARHITAAHDLDLIATGDLLRAEAAAGTEVGREVAPIMAAGELVPDDLMVRVIESRLRKSEGRSGVLLDGFPRTLAQAQAFDTMLGRAGRRLDLLVALDLAEEELRERILRRAEEEGRADDTPETVRTRFDVYLSETTPVLTHYEARRVNIQHVDGAGTIDEVRERINGAFATLAIGGVAS